MAGRNCVVLKLGSLIEAARQTGPKRAPKGARGTIAKSTLIYGDGDFLVIETPVLATGVPIDGGKWTDRVACHPFDFPKILQNAAKAWKDVGGPDASVTLTQSGKNISIIWEGETSRRVFSVNSLRIVP